MQPCGAGGASTGNAQRGLIDFRSIMEATEERTGSVETGAAQAPFLRTRLSIQMFLQFAIWGAWVPVLGNHLWSLGIRDEKISYVYLTGPLALMICPLIAGQIADRLFATQHFMALMYFASAGMFFLATKMTDYAGMWWVALGAMAFFGPTLGLGNALCFHHLKEAQRDFPRIRVWGTLGWIAAGWALAVWVEKAQRPIGDCFYFAAALCVVNGIYVLTLPHTPPRKNAPEQSAIGKVLRMLGDPSFAVFSVIAFLMLVFATAYYNLGGIFIENGIGFSKSEVGPVLSIGQIMEIGTMLVLPFFLVRLGPKWTIAIGILAWAVRFALYAAMTPALIYVAQGLHGVCFAFGIAGAMIYIERISAADIRGSMQSYLSFITYGLGMVVGSLLIGKVFAAVSTRAMVDGKEVTSIDWQTFWLVPAGGCFVVFVLFAALFRPREPQP
jgi:nucleoside transporter